MKPIFFKSALDFRKWLSKNFKTEDELWVGFYKVATGKPSLTWSESVNQALCYGWIDGLRKSIDSERYMIRFTPRRPGSIWSRVNLKKMDDLISKGLMTEHGMQVYQNRKPDKKDLYSFEQVEIKFPVEFEKTFRSNRKAWNYFKLQNSSYRKAATWWVISAKQENTRLKRLQMLIEDSEDGRYLKHLRRTTSGE